jgi:hypothetical protein
MFHDLGQYNEIEDRRPERHVKHVGNDQIAAQTTLFQLSQCLLHALSSQIQRNNMVTGTRCRYRYPS